MENAADARGPAGARSFTLSVVSHGQGPLLEHLLSDLAALAPPLLARVIVTRNLCEPCPRVPANLAVPLQLIDNPRPKGFGANHNAAFAHSDTDWFVVANPDIRLPADPFPALLRAGAPGVGLVAPTVLEPDGRTADSARPLPSPAALLRRYLGGRRTARPSGPPAWYAGMFLALRREAYTAVRGFDERYHLYCEDVDLCARLRLSGWQLRQAGDARVVHAAQRASRRSLRYLGWHLQSLARLWRSDAWRRYRALLAAEQRGRGASPH